MAKTEEDSSRAQGLKRNNQVLKSRLRLVLVITLVATAAGYGYWWLFLRNRVTTDNAYVVADTATVSSRVPGTITRIDTDNDDFVEQGDVLVVLDTADYRIRVERQRAALKAIEARIQEAGIKLELTDSHTSAQVQAARADLDASHKKEDQARHRLDEMKQSRVAAIADVAHAERDFRRYSNLLKARAGSEQQRDRASTAFKVAKARLEVADAQIAEANAALGAAMQQVAGAEAQLESAQANRLQVDIQRHSVDALKAKQGELQASLQMAELNLSYCTIHAPISGYVAQKRIQIGQRIQPGQPLLAIVPLHHAYVEANFKETQLESVRLGQPVEIDADIYPGHTYHGKVAGIRAGTGAAFSILPPENATGNWIKVVQRVPVKVVLNEPPSAEYPLRVGLSLEITVITTDSSGPRLLEGARHREAQKPAAFQ